MNFNFLLVLNANLFLTSTLLVTNIYISKIYELSYFINVLSKLTLDDFYLFNFYFIWSSFYIMFMLFLFIFCNLFTYKSILFFNKSFFYLVLITILFSLNLLDYYFFNVYNFNNDVSLSNYNVLLTNSINKLHPLFLYSSIYYIISLFILNNVFYRYLHQNFNFLNSVFTLISTVSYLTVTLILGSWWAFQEGSWGGWWDWDVSEVFGLLVLLNILKILHHNVSSINNESYTFLIGCYVHILFIFYLFMQLNFSLISHNFNLHTLSTFASSLNYLILLLTFVCVRVTLIKNKVKLFIDFVLNSKLGWKLARWLTFKLVLITFSSLIVLFSTFSMFTSWLWANFTLNYFSELIGPSDLLNLLLILLIPLYWNFILAQFIIYSVFIYKTVSIFFIILCAPLVSLSSVHYFIYLCLSLCTSYRFTEFTCWSYLLFGFNELHYYTYDFLKVDSPMLNVSKHILSVNLFSSNNFNWWYNFSVLDFKTFDLTMSLSSISQNLVYDSEFNTFVTQILCFVENPLLVLILLVLVLIVYNKLRSLVIIF